MATRSDPPLPLARLRSRGQLTEVRAADLRFTRPEAVAFLNDVMGLDLTDGRRGRALERAHRGLGRRPAARRRSRCAASEEREEVAAFIEAFTGSNRFVIDYLADEVLARQPGQVRSTSCSAPPSSTGSPAASCDAVTGRADGARVLEDLERDNLFVVPLDAQRSWYRYHHLFADVLRARLLAEHPDEVPDLHRRASAWYAAHDLSRRRGPSRPRGRGLRPCRPPDGGGACRTCAGPGRTACC